MTESVQLTPRYIKEICRQKGLYSTPHLNDKLYLHFKGITKIESLDEYVGLKVLWLEGNAITKIENLEKLTELRALYLHKNCIDKIENLSHLSFLDQLNVSENFIDKVEGLDELENLKTLTINDNQIKTTEDLIGLTRCPSLSVVDLSSNKILDPEIVEKVFSLMPNLRVLRLEKNPVVNKIPNYRRRLIITCKELTYLDNMPVFEEERRTAEAWGRGGVEEERKEREKIAQEIREKERRNFEALEDLLREARLKKESRGTDVVDTYHDTFPTELSDSDSDSDDKDISPPVVESDLNHINQVEEVSEKEENLPCSSEVVDEVD
ncbi:dynein assembly factor dnaaf1 [Acrasis kona]|uniref:Dynein assembly factor dnaaf1 n=1 Tax=Acrasis kona TaxID=1008807 RepID=A0AAW2ZA68_9EUKA